MHILFKVKYLSDGSLLVLTQDKSGWTVYRGEKTLGSYLHNVWGGGSLRIMTFSEQKEAAGILAFSLTAARDVPIAAWWERIAGKDDKWRVVKDGQPADNVLSTSFWDAQQPALSGDGMHVAYPAYVKPQAGGEDAIFVITDGNRLGPYKHVWGVKLASKGERLVYAGSDGAKDRAWTFYSDGKPLGSKYDAVWAPEICPDGSHVVWLGTREGRVYFALDGSEVASGEKKLWGPSLDRSGNLWAVLGDSVRAERVDVRNACTVAKVK